MGDTSGPIRSEKYWFEDGDTVLSVEADGAEHHFRVHRAILIIHSPVFRDMFSIPQPSDDKTLTVPLNDDSVQDVTALLGALYNARFVVDPYLSRMNSMKTLRVSRVAQIVTFDVALGTLRLAHKYQCMGLQEMIKLKLLEDWPLNRSQYISRLAYIGSGGERIHDALKLIEAAQRCQLHELLPTAFYEIACAWGTRWEEIAPHISPDNLMRLSVGRARCEKRLRSFVTWTETMTNSDSFKESKAQYDRVTRQGNRLDNNQCIQCVQTIGSTFRSKVERLVFRGSFALLALGQFCRENLGKSVEQFWADWFMSLMEDKIRECWESIPTDFDVQVIHTQ